MLVPLIDRDAKHVLFLDVERRLYIVHKIIYTFVTRIFYMCVIEHIDCILITGIDLLLYVSFKLTRVIVRKHRISISKIFYDLFTSLQFYIYL